MFNEFMMAMAPTAVPFFVGIGLGQLPCEMIAAQLGALFQCSVTSRGHVRIRTPFYYPDGGLVDVFLVTHDGQESITDFGEALGWLRSQSIRGRRTPKQDKLIQDVCLTQGVELFKGQIVSRLPGQALLARTVIRVSQAAVRMADLWFTMRTQAIESTTDEVADLTGRIAELRAQMTELAKALRYEDAAKVRDRIRVLEGLFRSWAR